MGGHIGVTSQPGQGSTFWLTLPLVAAENLAPYWTGETPPPALPLPPLAPEATPSAGSPVILLAEDNPVNQRLAQFQLHKLGYALHMVEYGQIAVDWLARSQRGEAPAFAAVLMDCQMPVMDGFEATATIRRAERAGQRRVPIIAMTANAMQGDRERCLAAGMDDYLSKPIQIDQLRQLLNQWAGPPAADTSAAPQNAEPPTLAPLPAPGEPARVAADGHGERINLQLLESYFGDDPQMVTRLLDLFHQSTQALMARLADAVTQRNAPVVAALAHELRGACGNMGMARMTHWATQLQAQADALDWPGIDQSHQHLVADFGDVVTLISQR